MTGNFRIGRILGIEVNLHWSWLFIFVLITWTFSAGVLENFYPDWTAAQRWVVGSAMSGVFFLCILLHELSHSLVARRYGLPVSSITLFLFGGVSNLTKEPDSATQEFRIAIVGPLTSFGLALLFAVAYLALSLLNVRAAGVWAIFAEINLMLGTFNLVPGFPLDGGRVLRSILWQRKGDRLEATRQASIAGRVVGYMLMGLGVVAFLFVDLISGVWLFLVGNLVNGLAQANYEQLLVETTLKNVPVATVARKDFVALAPDTTLGELAEEYILSGKGRGFPVVAGEELLGLVTIADLRRIPREAWQVTSVYKAMTPFAKLRTVSERDDLTAALAKLAIGDIHQVPLVDGKRLVAMLDRSDLIRYMQLQSELRSHAAAA